MNLVQVSPAFRGSSKQLSNYKHINRYMTKFHIPLDAVARFVISMFPFPDQWYEPDRSFTGEGTPQLYRDLAIITCHEIRQVFKLPLRQTEGFINSLFDILNLSLRCP
ncbi:MAG: hypothetical protein GY782_06425, partial [Gammaproteobacteria bacterium]|nr:hypothetical protein [Gammaproteobacteria bacterium]